jgi:outer membrane protein OmpA-like peptidoglycan-associated protein
LKDDTPADANGIPVRRGDDSFFAIPADALFDFDKDIIKPAAELELGRVGALVQWHLSRAQKGGLVQVNGYTDSVGNAAYNKQLSERRARAVADWLINHKYVTADQVRTEGWGSSNPKAPNGRPADRAKNRRVEFFVIKR